VCENRRGEGFHFTMAEAGLTKMDVVEVQAGLSGPRGTLDEFGTATRRCDEAQQEPVRKLLVGTHCEADVLAYIRFAQVAV
jgi:hypothetical protein